MVAVDDRTLVTALVAGDPRGLQDAYGRYADRLYTYCYHLLGVSGPATDAVHHTFVLASQRAYRLREPERLRCWLYAIARSECRRIRRGRRRQYRLPVAAGPPEAEPGDEWDIEPVTGLPVAEVEALVATAAAGLRPVDRELFRLAVRHELSASEIGELLGLPPAQVPARLDHAQERLEGALATLLGAPAETQPGLAPADVVSGYAAAPFRAAPDLLWPRLELNCFDPGFALERAAVVRRAGRFARRTGFPRSPHPQRRRRVAVAGAATVAVGVLVAGTGAVLPDSDPGQRTDLPAAASKVTAPAGPPGPVPDASPVPGRSARSSPTPSASPTDESPPATSAAPPESTAPPALTVQASGDIDCLLLFGYTLEVTATADRRLDTAELVLAAGSDRRSYEMDVDGSAAEAETEPLGESEFAWWVEVTGDDRQSAGTDPVEVTRPC